MKITVKEAFDQRLHHKAESRITYQGNLVYQLSRSMGYDNKFLIQFDKRHLLPVTVSSDDVLEIEPNLKDVASHSTSSGIDNLFNTIARNTDELGKAYSEINRLKEVLLKIRVAADVGLLFDGHDELNEHTHAENEKLLTQALDQIYQMADTVVDYERGN